MAAWAAVPLLLLLPLLAMQVTDQVVWDFADFAIFGALLVGAGIAYELIARKTDNIAYRSAVSVALAAAFMLVWVNGAVGVIGTENDAANLMFGGVLVVGIMGTIIARGRPHGMALVMLATALAQALVAVIALIAGLGSTGPIWPLDILMMTVFFAALWLISALLFRRALRG
jgi:hypothetical protein